MNLRPALIAIALAFVTATAPVAARVRTVTDPNAPRSLPDEGPVSVRWEDPATFTDIRYTGNRWEAKRGNWVEDLAVHLRDSAQRRLPPGERLEVDITDIRRAGMFEGWHGPDLQNTRIIRDVYPPRMTLQIRRTDASGRVIAEGERRLWDPGFLMNANSTINSDALRYEKSMIDRWVRRELAEPGT